MPHIFLSYNHNDHVFALKMMKPQLEEAGFEVWTDDDIKAGTAWREEIDTKIRTAMALVVIMSPDARESEYVTYEWACAWGAHVPVIPVIHRQTTMHPRLESLQYLDFTVREPPWKKLFERLREIGQTTDVIQSASADASSQAIDYHRLIDHLESGDDLSEFYAIKEFVAIGEPALEVLHYLLRSSNWYRRQLVVRVLKELRSPKSVTPLARLLSIENRLEVSSEALEALEAIGTDDAHAAYTRWHADHLIAPPTKASSDEHTRISASEPGSIPLISPTPAPESPLDFDEILKGWLSDSETPPEPGA